MAHGHQERNHQGMDNRLLQPGKEVGRNTAVLLPGCLSGLAIPRQMMGPNDRSLSELLFAPSG